MMTTPPLNNRRALDKLFRLVTLTFIIGNERTGLWKKAFGLAQSDELVKIVESVLNDAPTSSGGK